ncbi:hypothetical protein OESDEN_00512 [Oesophagostomum dentatum]|uniref:Methyltransferase domain-containing protein n=1 Tax=Oesophagostomum dentatum TaxID=61180 RepID=A0A0B1TTK4_OESDE|nr:hypothetical protein OESDEN_00512 [Oesophagostomum dentatum]
MGHLTRVLSLYLPECDIISVEQNDTLIHRSTILNERLQRVNGNFTTPKHYRESVHDGVSDSVIASLKKGQKALIIGLHACGDLSASILRIFVNSPQITAVILFGCCYHKLTITEKLEECSQTDSADPCFPLSSKYRRKHLSHAARDLACHGNEIFAEHLLTKPHIAYRMQCYRAVLESLMASTTSEVVRGWRSSIVVRSVACKDGMSFIDYMRSALLKYPEVLEILEEQIARDESAVQFINSVDKEWRRLLVVHCLRLLLAPFVEQLIIRDRVQYLEEHGHSAAVVPLFNPRISPRNFAIIAMKNYPDNHKC